MRPVIVTALGGSTSPPLAWTEARLRARRTHADLVAVRSGVLADDAALLLQRALDEYPRRREEVDAPTQLDLVIARGELAIEIARAARDDRAALVVTDEALWPAAEIASQIAYLVRHARCPVLLVRSGPSTGILVGAIDPTGTCGHVMSAVTRETSAHPRGFAFLVHVRTGGPDVSDEEARAPLHALQQRHRVRGATIVVAGRPARALVDSARELRAELVIVGGTRLPGAGVTLGPTATEIVREAPCSVLVIPPPQMLPIAPPRRAERARG
jgi:nucleotide-binding universal stress UspA family protein